MGFLGTLFMLWLGYQAIKFLRFLYIVKNSDLIRDPRMGQHTQHGANDKDGAALDATACPNCGSYTTTKCDRVDCAH